MHGDMPQSSRNETLKRFKDGEIVLLVCSDVAARGLDIAGVSHVFNFDVPFHAEDYVHRIGRTGRAGMTGRAWTIATGDDDKYVEAIERLIKRKIPLEKLEGSSRSGGGESQEKRDRQPDSRNREPRGHDQGRHGGREHRPERDRGPQRDSHHRPQAENRPPQRPQAPERIRQDEDDEEVAAGFGSEMPDFFKQK